MAGLLLVVLVGLLYGQVWRHQFVRFDDFDYIVDNPQVLAGPTWESVRWAFTTFHMANWHPITWLSHMVDCAAFGPAPGWHHLIGVAFHALNALLLLVFLRSTTRRFWPSVTVAFLFAIHPLRVESVAWAAERKDLLAGTFWILTMLAYARYVRRPGAGRYVAVFAMLAAGLMAKPMLVTLPFVLLLLDVWPLRRARIAGRKSAKVPDATTPIPAPPDAVPWSRLLLEKIPLIGLSIASSAITVAAQHSFGAVEKLDEISLSARIANALVGYVTYLRRTLWPSGLAFFYPHPAVVSSSSLASLVAPAVGAGLFLAAVTVFAVRSVRRRPYLAVGWFWYLGTLVPVIGILQVGNQATADRYTYMPLIGIYLLACWGAWDLTLRRPRLRPVMTVAALLLLTAYASVTWVQVGYWSDSRALFERALRVTADNYVAHNNLGNLFARRGDLAPAERHYDAALRIKPDLVEAHNNLGTVLARLGDQEGARRHYRRALDLRPGYPRAHYNLAITLEALGHADLAEASYRRAISLDPDLGEARERLGRLLAARGQCREAAKQFRLALASNPRLTGAAEGLARILATSDDPSLCDGAEEGTER